MALPARRPTADGQQVYEQLGIQAGQVRVRTGKPVARRPLQFRQVLA